ncbi:ATP synthase gamma chain [Marinicauda pacifica]|jgi:F-type H+-transporting ATPase subunit gamma|uniref:ATP synthase gamma chain n=1 Tax=Marinicauda pacifica TaxID=1133559 RepID=A0A4S2HA40_9PROT|nr:MULTISPECIES: F0F1 ATP synthase subunit gamma [Marinicauda]TGY92302.1 F0F1 ATP synthase subunit gamma [Marinicauda pacifica]GGE47755.1 ATP synthase gamma chain [Marinicauda pacifica]
MASLKELKNRITSVNSTKKITKAMQMVAAAKLRRAQEAAELARPYAEKMNAVVANLSNSMTGPDAPRMLIGTGKSERYLLVVATADRGLCGGFNTNIVRRARERISELLREGKSVEIITVGKKGYEQLKRLYADKIVERIELRDVKKIDSATAGRIGTSIRTRFEAGEFDVCQIISAEFVNVMTQKPQTQTIIPAREAIDDSVPRPDLKGALYEYEPDEESILEALLPRYVDTVILSSLLENAAGEMGARMAAMDSATRNAGELIDKLNLEYNRTRQAKITTELIEIIAGAEAV